MLTVGLTGGIATGKSFVAELLRSHGCHILHADSVAHDQIARDGAAFDQVVGSFGEDILGEEGDIDRAKLGAIVFADPAKLKHLNDLVHPHILAITEREIKRFSTDHPEGVFVAEAALHIEVGFHRRFEKLIVTWCTEEQQLERLLERPGVTRTAAEQRIRSQMPADTKKGYADYVVDCSGSKESTREQVARIYETLTALARSKE